MNPVLADRAYEVSLEVARETTLLIDDFDEQHLDETKVIAFRKEYPSDVQILVFLPSRIGHIQTSLSLTKIALLFAEIFESVFEPDPEKSLLSNSTRFELDKLGIDIPTLLDLRGPREERCAEYMRMYLGIFFLNLGIFGEVVTDQALGNTLIGFVEHVVNPSLKEHWQELGLPRGFSLIGKEQEREFRKFFQKKTLWFLGDKKQLINREKLPDEAKELLRQYQDAKARFLEIAEGVGADQIDELQATWDEVSTNEFPSLNNEVLASLTYSELLTPSEMVIQHLADYYSYHPDRIKQILAAARRSRRKRTKK